MSDQAGRGLMAPSLDVPPRVSSFLVKVASRCNLRCDYCYVYEHADQSWRKQPKVLSAENEQLLAKRLGEYALAAKLERLLVVFHGGEPLLFGARRLAALADRIREALPPFTAPDFSLQTNGVLLTEQDLLLLERARIGVSVSLDGPPSVHDRHRPDAQGRSSSERTLEAIRLLQRHPDTFSGVIGVIDPSAAPKAVLDYFAALNPPRLDLLLPDANHLRLPPGREDSPALYSDWLIKAFDYWFDHHPNLRIRFFESILDGLVGLPSGTDAFGQGDISLLTVETDGSYHDLDVLKTTYEGRTSLGCSLANASIAEVLSAPRLREHREMLRLKGLAAVCQGCSEREVCGGGSVPHRFGANGFANPTVYCSEMKALLSHARSRLVRELERPPSAMATRGPALPADWVGAFELAGSEFVGALHERAAQDAEARLRDVLTRLAMREPAEVISQLLRLPSERFRAIAALPSMECWARVASDALEGRATKSIAGRALCANAGYLRDILAWEEQWGTREPRLHRDDPWLRLPFDGDIEFEGAEVAEAGRERCLAALAILDAWCPGLVDEIGRLSPEIQFIRDRSAHPEKAVSFSDNVVPGALYVGVRHRGGLIEPAQLADSILHEHRHQRLYLVQRVDPLIARDWPTVSSPWRDEPRPPSGLLHALYVFTGLLEFWAHLRHAPDSGTRAQASAEIEGTCVRLAKGFETIRACNFTPAGSALVESLYERVAQFDAGR